MNEHQELVVVQPTQLARVNPMDTLALMSEQEFEQRLDGLKTAQRRMERIQRELMKENVDYGIIPGTGDKPTLLKPGTERLCKFHHLVPTFEVETVMGDGVTRPHIRVLTTCSLHYESEDGPIVAQGMGAANSWEKKYRWRDGQRRCPECGAAAIIKGKAEFGGGYLCWAKKGGCGAKFGESDTSITDQQAGQIENPDPFDLENTIRKISAKRAQTDATLRATATSGLFSQDLEDIDVGDSNAHATQERKGTTQPVPGQPSLASDAQIKAMYFIGRNEHGKTEDEVDDACKRLYNCPAVNFLGKKEATNFIDRLKTGTVWQKEALAKPTTIMSEEESAERGELLRQIKGDAAAMLISDEQLHKDAKKKAGVAEYWDGSTEYLRGLANRMALALKSKQSDDARAAEGEYTEQA